MGWTAEDPEGSGQGPWERAAGHRKGKGEKVRWERWDRDGRCEMGCMMGDICIRLAVTLGRSKRRIPTKANIRILVALTTLERDRPMRYGGTP